MYFIGQLVGALIPVYLISRITLWIARKWYRGLTPIVIAHALTSILTITLASLGFANGGAPRFYDVGFRYLPAILVCLLSDLILFFKQN